MEILNSRKILLLLSAMVISTLLFFSYLYFGEKLPGLYSFIDSFITVSLFTACMIGIRYLVRVIEFSKAEMGKFFLSHLGSAFLIAVLVLTLSHGLMTNFLIKDSVYIEHLHESYTWRFFLVIIYYFIVISFMYMIKFYMEYTLQIKKEAELRNLVTQAELKTLKFQINPHFIFNSLNSIAALTTLNSEKAGEMVLKLADFMRYTLKNDLHAMNPLKEEIENIRRYLEMEKIRFDDKFTYNELISTECMKVLVPNMILQPLFENAIKYGVYEALNTVGISMDCKLKNNFMVITVENEFEPDSIPQKGAGVGLKNIRQRLKLMYEMDDLLRIQKDGSKFRAILYIPIVVDERKEA